MFIYIFPLIIIINQPCPLICSICIHKVRGKLRMPTRPQGCGRFLIIYTGNVKQKHLVMYSKVGIYGSLVLPFWKKVWERNTVVQMSSTFTCWLFGRLNNSCSFSNQRLKYDIVTAPQNLLGKRTGWIACRDLWPSHSPRPSGWINLTNP